MIFLPPTMSREFRRCTRCGQQFSAASAHCHHCHGLTDRQLRRGLASHRRRAGRQHALGLLLLLAAFLIGFFMFI